MNKPFIGLPNPYPPIIPQYQPLVDQSYRKSCHSKYKHEVKPVESKKLDLKA